MTKPYQLVDRFNRSIEYLRLSVTDRCDFRCTYCMAEDMTFVPRADILSLEEMLLICRTFIALGVSKIRITGGEPLIRKDIDWLLMQLSQEESLKTLCLTTNGSQLEHFAPVLKRAQVKRLNISLDTLNPMKFQRLTRYGKLDQVLRGIEAARRAGIEHIKINSVVLKSINADEVLSLVEFCLERELDIAFIEEMPLGSVNSHSRKQEFISSADLRNLIEQRYALSPLATSTGGPARYWQTPGHPSKLGFISPHSENFCQSCNRVRVTAEGKLLLCLGNEHSVDLKKVMRESGHDEQVLQQTIIESMQIKPERHHFIQDDKPEIVRFMNATGG